MVVQRWKIAGEPLNPYQQVFGLLLSLLWLNISKPPLEKHFISAGLLKSAEFVANMISVVDKEKS